MKLEINSLKPYKNIHSPSLDLLPHVEVADQDPTSGSLWNIINDSYFGDVVELEGDLSVVDLLANLHQLSVNTFNNCLAQLSRQNLIDNIAVAIGKEQVNME